MNKGYLICKSSLDKIEELVYEKKVFEEITKKDISAKERNSLINNQVNSKDEKNSVKAIKCPFTGELIEKSKIRKVFFFWKCMSKYNK